jgi:hypothetical protein
MNCFSHPQDSAVGVCRVCHRGLCPACAADHGHSLSCKGEHEAEAAAIHALNLRSTKLLKVSKKSMFLGPFFFGVCGLVFLVDGIRKGDIFNFGTYLGAAFLVFAVAILVANMRAFGGSETKND